MKQTWVVEPLPDGRCLCVVVETYPDGSCWVGPVLERWTVGVLWREDVVDRGASASVAAATVIVDDLVNPS